MNTVSNVFINGIRAYDLEKLHNEKLHSSCRAPNIVWMIRSIRLRWAGHEARKEEGRRAFKILTRKPTGKRPLGTPKHSLEDNIRINLK